MGEASGPKNVQKTFRISA